MSTCWKCGATVPVGQLECEYGCQTQERQAFTDKHIENLKASMREKTVEIDWDKVVTIDDVQTVFRAMFGDHIYFPSGVPESIKRFLKSKEGK